MSYHIWIALAVAGLGGAGCAQHTTSEPAFGDYRVRVFNDSPYALSNVHVVTGQGAEFSLARLEHGELSAERVVNRLHEAPAVTLTVEGQALSSLPIEGFTGFNPQVAPGAYVIDLAIVGSPRVLQVTLSQPVEDATIAR
ncbi:MAG TPA: hypothetical protein VFS57_10480 [Gemmatimonadaceae bacterium]|nr:hypothetical protein [Gemmatimonadaceae bacterium]